VFQSRAERGSYIGLIGEGEPPSRGVFQAFFPGVISRTLGCIATLLSPLQIILGI
jgi:hypothetical protein